MTTTLVEGSVVEQVAGDLAVVVFEAMREAGWSGRFVDEVAELVRAAALAATGARARRLAELLDEGVELVAA